MKFALITGPNGFDLVKDLGLGYHLVLAQHCISDRKYMDFYCELHRMGHFLILDNGAAEMQHAIPFEDVLKVAEDLQPEEIVMPDALGNFDETCRLILLHINSVVPRRRMGVPQGKDWDEWTRSLELMLSLGMRTIGIAKRYEALEGGRCQALRLFNERSNGSVDVHLLGCYKNPWQEALDVAKKFPWVRGLDSAAPLAHAQQKFSMHDIVGHISYEWDDPFSHAVAYNNVLQMVHACT
jgi:hypothetical protein